MDFKKINEQIIELIDLNQQLEKMNYNDSSYDALEDKIHDIQDYLNNEHGSFFEKIITGIYKQLNSDDEILNFTDYIARTYKKSTENESGIQYLIDPDDSISVTFKHESLKGKLLEGSLYFKPNPLRIAFLLGTQERILWNSEEKK
jgi:hypothetical protein